MGDLGPDAVLQVLGERVLYASKTIDMYIFNHNKCDAIRTLIEYDTHEARLRVVCTVQQ